ncbi:hypothetical protein TPR58_03710 [Sphingomonas sp. HF-S3]|uniref:Preprotein translocase subunit YajC n=1 Tax=Sphingomonas rustica TaxID=3103142 RepID=A0ABV0B6W1_9SPHN
MTRSGLCAAVVLVGAGAAQPAMAQRTTVDPYIEVGQVVTADLGDGGEVLTYSTVAAGIDATVQTRRVQVQASYRYEHRFSYDKRVGDDSIHTGLANARVVVAPGLTMEAGALATRARSDVRGEVAVNPVYNTRNISQVYSAYVGPSLATHVGPLFVNGAYRFGYTKVEAPTDGVGLPGGTPPLDLYDDSRVHVATLSTGVKAGTVLPIGVTVSGSYTREDAGQLDQRFEGKFGRGDVVLPVARGLALTAGVGYEKIEISQRDPLLTPGPDPVPVVDGAGRQVTDPASPRRIAYDFDGIFWDAGVLWRPSSRTTLEARVGRRYGSMSVIGSLSYQIGPSSGIQIGIYDAIESYGRQLNGGLATLPNGFVTGNDPFGNQTSSCVFGSAGNAAGSCLTGALSSATTGNYRARGVTGVLVLGRGGTTYGLGAGYARRSYLTPGAGLGNGISLSGTADETYFAQLFASQQVGPNGSLGGNAYVNYVESDVAVDPILGWGANAVYTHRFGRLTGTLAAGISGFQGQAGQDALSAQALIGLRYGF